ncbi:MAG: 16S rRNA (cytosine(1402)-N(4))-methyltransferase RsmH, partial [bacterium]
SNFTAIKANFSKINLSLSSVLRPLSSDGFLFDLGVSSHQFDQASRGFSIQEDGPLDMRMDLSAKITAADIVNTYSQKDLVDIFGNYGNEPFSGRIARVIFENRPINSTLQLSQIIQKIVPKKDPRKRLDSVVRVFQALRIVVNNELGNLEKALNDAISLLKPEGRIVVISYHSGEDRIVKNIFREHNKKDLNILTKKPLMASDEEIRSNPRARSAKLRAAEKI